MGGGRAVLLRPALPLESLSVAAYKFPGKPLIRAGTLWPRACQTMLQQQRNLRSPLTVATPFLLPFDGFLHTNTSDLSPLNTADTQGYMVLNHVFYVSY